ncbi:MAG: triose-phosphate isomerase [Gammaproteobacteria bacterium]|nr:triose-phosphate isomerase [Gammaproteobacteria bacterium]
MRGYLIAGNWKMNGSKAANAKLTREILAGWADTASVRLLVCPPYPYLGILAETLSGTPVALGAQNVSQHASGAYTGEVSPGMLKDMACEFVIVGHSERRALMGESSDIVAEKFAAAISAGLRPILCVGETLEEREQDRTEAVIDEQLDAVLDRAGIEAFDSAVIAYEPVWAIGTGRTASPQQAQDVHRHIRSRLAARNAEIAEATQILYGGSVKGDNAAGLFTMPDIDGGLIGGASLKAGDFLAIAAAAASLG